MDTLTKYTHYKATPYNQHYAEVVACGRRVNRLSIRREAAEVTCPKCLLCAANHIGQLEVQPT